jgi:hypothetical protein
MGNLMEALAENGYACNICYAQEYAINLISSRPSTMCAEHYQEWSEEKNMGENY